MSRPRAGLRRWGGFLLPRLQPRAAKRQNRRSGFIQPGPIYARGKSGGIHCDFHDVTSAPIFDTVRQIFQPFIVLRPLHRLGHADGNNLSTGAGHNRMLWVFSREHVFNASGPVGVLSTWGTQNFILTNSVALLIVVIGTHHGGRHRPAADFDIGRAAERDGELEFSTVKYFARGNYSTNLTFTN